jgi:hypothetical protein
MKGKKSLFLILGLAALAWMIFAASKSNKTAEERGVGTPKGA